jgi:hypothetical protein
MSVSDFLSRLLSRKNARAWQGLYAPSPAASQQRTLNRRDGHFGLERTSLVARRLKTTEDLFDNRTSLLTESMIASAVLWAERIVRKIALAAYGVDMFMEGKEGRSKGVRLSDQTAQEVLQPPAAQTDSRGGRPRGNTWAGNKRRRVG